MTKRRMHSASPYLQTFRQSRETVSLPTQLRLHSIVAASFVDGKNEWNQTITILVVNEVVHTNIQCPTTDDQTDPLD